MAGITAVRGTTYNLPNYHGELFQISPSDAPFLTAIGGLSGGKRATGTIETEWQAYDLRDPALRQRLEGADAPDAEARVRMNLDNVLEIHQETVDVSYTKLAAVNQFSGANIGGQDNPVVDEYTWQINQALKTKALDVEFSFLHSRYQKPDTNADPRKTRGLIQAIEQGISGDNNLLHKGTSIGADVAVTVSNDRFAKASHGLSNGDEVVVIGGTDLGFPPSQVFYVVGQAAGYFSLAATKGGAAITPEDDGTVEVIALAAIDGEDVIDLLQRVWENGGIRESETATLLVGASRKRLLTAEFITKAGYQEQTRNVGGVNVTTIETDFGRVNVMLHRRLGPHEVVLASLEQCVPVMLEIPGKGFLFVEPLGKKGASEQSQLYGEIGLEYGNPLAHGMLIGKAAA